MMNPLIMLRNLPLLVVVACAHSMDFKPINICQSVPVVTPKFYSTAHAHYLLCKLYRNCNKQQTTVNILSLQ
jgi:hypothetical protein